MTIRDQQPRYNMHFGVPLGDANVTSSANTRLSQGAPDPNSGLINKAFYKHPIAKFLAVTVGTAVAVQTSQNLVKKGGIRLADRLVGGVDPLLNKEWAASLNSHFRSTQRILDEWEGIHRNVGANGKTINTIRHAGFDFTQADKAAAAEKTAAGDWAEPVDDWLLRDEIQQRLVNKARALPYALPGAYVASKVIDRFSTNPDQRHHTDWANPVDVIGDFAAHSVKSVTSMMLPQELGGATLKYGWQRAMTYGDIVSRTQPFNGRMQNTTITLQNILSNFGHSASDLLDKASKVSQKTTGSFAHAINESLAERRPEGYKYRSRFIEGFRDRDIATTGEKQGFARRRFNAIKNAPRNTARGLGVAFEGAGADINDVGWAQVPKNLFPGSTRLVKSFRSQWDRIGDDQANQEALYAQRSTYIHKGQTRIVDPTRKASGGAQSSGLEQFAASVIKQRPMESRNGRLTGTFSQTQKEADYVRILSDQIASRVKPTDRLLGDEVAQKRFNQSLHDFVNGVQLKSLPSLTKNAKYDARQSVQARLRIGADDIHDSDDLTTGITWEKEFNRRLEAIVPHQGDRARIMGALRPSVKAADSIVLSPSYIKRQNLRIMSQWGDIYTKAIIPDLKATSHEIRLGNEYASENMSPLRKEELTRRLAKSVGVDVENKSTSIINRELGDMGVDTHNYHRFRAHLMDHKIIGPSWKHQGFNVLGLRPLTVQEGLDRHFFAHDVSDEVANLHKGIRDKFIGNRVSNIAVGNGVYLNRAGNIVDLSYVRGTPARVLGTFAKHIQVPFLHFGPLDMFGFRAWDAMSRQESIQIQATIGRHRSGVGIQDADNLVFIKNQRGSKGRAYLHTEGRGVSRLAGTHRAVSANLSNMISRNISLGYGQSGVYKPARAVDAGSQPLLDRLGMVMPRNERAAAIARRLNVQIPNDLKNRTYNWLNVNPVQDESLFKYGSRLKRSRLANRIRVKTGRDPIVDLSTPENIAHHLAGRDQSLPLTHDEIAAIDRFQNNLRFNHGITPGTARKMQEAGEYNPHLAYLKNFFKVHFKGQDLDLDQVTDAGHMYQIIEHMLQEDRTNAATLVDQGNANNPNLLANLGSAQSFLRKVYLSQKPQNDAMGAVSFKNTTTTGLNRRLDEFRADVYKYIVARESLMGQQSSDVIQDLLNSLDVMRHKVLMQHADYVEARAAILGMQFNVANIRHMGTDLSNDKRVANVLHEVMNKGSDEVNEQSRKLLEDFGNYKSSYVGRFNHMDFRTRFNAYLGLAAPKHHHMKYQAFTNKFTVVPTTGTAIRHNPIRAIGSILGINSHKDPENLSMGSIPAMQVVNRLDRYFAMLGAGIDPTKYSGPASRFAVGMVGKRIFPVVALGTTAVALDRTAGAYSAPKDKKGHRQYRPLVGGMIATGLAHGEVALTPSKESRDRKRRQLFGEEDAPIRRGRYWFLGSGAIKGGRVMYYRPSWYRRYMSGYHYTDQDKKTPIHSLLYYQDYSPLRVLNPYKYEEEHVKGRPYPVTGDYFTGPWGPITPALNLTVGKILKPSIMMHKAELNQAMSHMNPAGEGMAAPAPYHNPYQVTASRNTTGGVGLFQTATAGDILGVGMTKDEVAPGEYARPFRQPYGFLGMTYATDPNGAIDSYRRNKESALAGPGNQARQLLGPASQQRNRSNRISNQMIDNYNQAMIDKTGQPAASRTPGNSLLYTGKPNQPSYYYGNSPYDRVVMTPNRSFDPRIMRASLPLDPHNKKYQAGYLGYATQEMAGIYGFAAGIARSGLGGGTGDLAPRRPVLQSASRAYGSERSYWDMNLGGLGDFSTFGLGEFGNVEFSEITRRFVPHRRHMENEVNPLRNQLGKQYPWLPEDYFINFKQGDPFSAVPEGELRLPGPGYAMTHKLHPDATGQYGLLDQLNILGNNSPWSKNYKAIDTVVKNMKLSPQDREFVLGVHDRVSQMKKRQTFHPYKYAHTDFETKQAKVTGFIPGEADVLMTDQGLVRFAGARAKGGTFADSAQAWLQHNVHEGQIVSLTYDANYPPKKDEPLDAIVKAGDVNLNKDLMKQPFGYEGRKQDPLDLYQQDGALSFRLKALGERIHHTNNFFINKISPSKSAIEDWERSHVYGSSFPEWNHPYQSYIKPLAYRAMNRNPVEAAIAVGFAGRMFGKTAQAKSAGQIIGGAIGLGLSLFSNSQTIQTGQRYIPAQVKKGSEISEYADILNYVKYSTLYSKARQQAFKDTGEDPETIAQRISNGKYKEYQYGNLAPSVAQALAYRNKMQQTEYGADVFGNVMNLAQAIPRNKRDHFMEFLKAPVNERQRILSTAPRLERRIYEARWGMKVEQRPDLTTYFQNHELPDQNWEGWQDQTDMEDIKLKVLQHQGVNMSQMGYYPQQVNEANALNYAYPDFNQKSSKQDIHAQLRNMFGNDPNMNGYVQMIPSRTPGTRIELQVGVYN